MPLNNSVLFVCTHNSARSQMAHGWLKHLGADQFRVYSAGVKPGTLHPMAVKAMAEVGIDIADHVAEGIDKYLGHIPIYHLITVCDKAGQSCPRVWPGAPKREHWSFDDPSSATGSDEQKLDMFRQVRDEIRKKIEAWIAEQPAPVTASTHNTTPTPIRSNTP